jgi:hypothetical protein
VHGAQKMSDSRSVSDVKADIQRIRGELLVWQQRMYLKLEGLSIADRAAAQHDLDVLENVDNNLVEACDELGYLTQVF